MTPLCRLLENDWLDNGRDGTKVSTAIQPRPWFLIMGLIVGDVGVVSQEYCQFSSDERLIDAWFCGYQLVGLFGRDMMVAWTMVWQYAKGGESRLACHLSFAPSTREILPGVGRELVWLLNCKTTNFCGHRFIFVKARLSRACCQYNNVMSHHKSMWHGPTNDTPLHERFYLGWSAIKQMEKANTQKTGTYN